MFKVKRNNTGEIYTVYGVSKEGNTTYFLFNNDMWYWDDADNYDEVVTE
jgi:hypothetical protein